MEFNMRHLSFALSSSVALLLSLPAHADFIGIYASADAWQYDGDISVAQTNKPTEKFNVDQQTQANLAVSIEHPVPFIPNVRIRYNELQAADTLNSVAFQFDNKTYLGNVDLDMQLNNTDFILYYEILDNIVSIDLGIAAKNIKGDVQVKGNTLTGSQTSTVSFNETIPMVYASVGGSLPFTGWSAKAEASGIQYQGSSLSDMQAEIKYDLVHNLVVDLGVKLGYRQINIKLDDIENTDADGTFKGPYLGMEVHF
jgi:outer membrane protein